MGAYCRCGEIYARVALPRLENCDECEKVWVLTEEESAEIRKRVVPVLTFNRIGPARSREDEIMDAIREIGRS